MADRRSSEDGPDASDDTGIISSEPGPSTIETDQRNSSDVNMSDKDQAPNAASVAAIIIPSPGNSEKKSVWFAPSIEAMDHDNEAPVPMSQTDHASKDSKMNKGPEVLDTATAPQPFAADSNYDSAVKEKEKMLQNEQSASQDLAVDDNINASEAATSTHRTIPYTALEESISRPRIDEEMQILPTRTTSRRAAAIQATVTTAVSDETIFDAFSQRASTMRYTEGDDIFIPEATLVEESIKEDIPSAEVVVPERYSVTVAGKKVHAGILAIVIILIVVLTISLSVMLTRSSSSKMPTQSPTMSPTSSPTSELYYNLVQRVYGDDNVDWNEDRHIAMSWLEKDQYNTPNSVTDKELRERYALALLYFISNADGSWFDHINFLSEDHVCTWRMKRSGEKKGVLLCDDDGRVVQLALYSNSLHGTLPMELKYLTEIEALRLDSNRIESSIPDAFGSLSKLSELILYSNAMTGYLPATFSNLGNLTTLHLSDNIFSGPLLDVDTISNLRTFRIDGNNFSGTIPQAFGSVYLDTFHINRNRFTGTIDFMCNRLPLDYKIDCDGTEPEVTCTCCLGCTIIGDDTCEKDEELASITISSGKYDDTFSWQLFREVNDGFIWSDLLAAGGEYDANEVVSFQLCLGYPGNYTFRTQSNSTVDSGASIEVSVSGSELFVGPQDFVPFKLSEDGSLEELHGQYGGSTDDAAPGGFGYGPNYDTDDESFNVTWPTNAVESVSSKQGPCIIFEMQLQTDSFGDEVSWDIVNAVDGAVVRSVDGGYYEGNTTYYEYDCLDPTGCYTFTIYDQWQDGICCGAGEGWFNISANGRFLYNGGDYKASDSVVIGGNCATTVAESGECPANTNSINVTVQNNGGSWETTSWEIYDNATGQIYCLNSSDVDNSFHTTHQCIPNDKCMVFAVDGFNETAGGSYEVTYNDEVIASNNDVRYQEQTYFGTCDK